MKVSVVIPVYQVEAYIEECLDSVRNQTLTDLEILCVDDCGTDGSWEKVRRAAGKDDRIRLLRNERNKGLAASRNRGLDQARGEYVYFLDSDDRITPDALSELVTRADRDHLDVIAFCASFIYENEGLREKFCRNPAVFKGEYPEVMSGKELYVRWMDRWDWMPSQPRYFYRRAFLQENNIRFPEGMLHEDEMFAFDVFMKAQRMKACPEKWFIRRFRADSIMTGQMSFRNVEGCIRILQHIAAEQQEYRKDPALHKAVCFYRKKIAENCRGKFLAAAGASGGEEAFRMSQEGPLLSVLIPVYDCEPYLEDCLQSVLGQPFMDLEVICVDDGSTDGSWELLSAYAEMDPRIRLLRHSRNRGQAAARNTALDAARGRMIYMLDADDWITDNALQEMYGYMVRDNLDVLGFENRQFAEEEAFRRQAEEVLFSYEKTEGLYSGREAFITCVEKDTLSPSVPTFMLKKDYILREGLRFEEGILHEDIGYIFAMLTRAGRVRLLHKPLFCRRFRAHSTVTRGFTPEHAAGYLKSWQKGTEDRQALRERFGDDPEFWHAHRKWLRDVAGRIRVLYLQAGESLYRAELPSGEETSVFLLELLRQTTTGRERAVDILGEETVRQIEEAKAVYVCGSGQYARRILDAAGALDTEIRGVLEQDGVIAGRKTFRGFKVLDPAEVTDRSLPVLLAVSHYAVEKYREMLERAGFEKLLSVRF